VFHAGAPAGRGRSRVFDRLRNPRHTASMSETLPVTVVTGFLGAGKTTLVNQWLARSERGEIAVIVNEHGVVGIDAALLAARARLIIEVNGGCICCTTHAELVSALDSIATSQTPPRRILIETSGAASPAGVLRAITAGGKSGNLILDGVISVFDVTRVNSVLGHDVAVEQLGFADLVVLSRTDECDRETLAREKDRLAAQNGVAAFVEAVRGEVTSPALRSLEELLASRRGGFVAMRLPPVTRGEHVYESVSLELETEVDEDRFAEFIECELAKFSGRIFRTKGILAVRGVAERMIVQGVADCMEVTFGEPWGNTSRSCRLVVVGFALDQDALRIGFSACACG
jgi:G3E family GTPase